jgi:pyruvate/2-oxoacid:ferredoxin oxidoreductase alpha subunit
LITEKKGERRVITGNVTTAYAVKLCKPDVIALYPITPQSEVVEQLTRF